MSRRPAAALLAIVLATSACAGGADTATDPADGPVVGTATPAGEDGASDEAASPSATAAPAAQDSTAGGDTAAALWWTAETTDGEQFVAADLAGDKVVLWLWAPWCSVCNREAPEVAQALADLPADVILVGVAGRDEVGPMRDFIAEHGLQDMTHVVDVDGSLWSSYGISYQPAWVFIDSEGEAAVTAGALGYDGIFAGLDENFASQG